MATLSPSRLPLSPSRLPLSPSRLPQLQLRSSEEPSPQIKAFIEKVIQCPLQDIAIPLLGFQWEYGKGNFNHWRQLFVHFDTYFKTYVSCRNELLLSNDILSDTSPLPKQEVLQILRVMQIILENCHNKSSFVGLEHFKLLLASTDHEILIAALETLAALVKIIPSNLRISGKLVGCGSMNSYLLSLAQGWGSKEEGLGLFSCISMHEKIEDDGLCLFPSEVQNDSDNLQFRRGSLYFELNGTTPGTSVIYLPDLQLREEDSLSLMKTCIEHYNVPLELRFSLLTRIRYVRAFRSSRMCRLFSKICLLAFIVLVQSSDSNDELVSFFANKPEYTNELIRIVSSEETISSTLRTLAMTALGAQLAVYLASQGRAWVLRESCISFAGGNRMILLNVLERAILLLKISSDLSPVAFVESLLQFYLFHVISPSSIGNVAHRSGMVPTILPLLEHSDPTHSHLVCLALKTLKKLMCYSNTAVTLLRDLGGVELLVHRLQIEGHRVIDNGGKDVSMATQKRVIRALLQALGSATNDITSATRSQYSNEVSLAPTLSIIFSNKEQFGGEIYAAAVTLMNKMIHKDPTCFNTLYDLGLPTTFLSSVVSGALPFSKAITCIPNGLGAICLNTKGLEAVKKTYALRFLFNIFTEKRYVMVMNECIVPLANNVEKLLRHVTSLISIGVDQMIEIIHKVVSLGCNRSAEKVEGNDAMEMESIVSKDKENFSSEDSSDRSMSDEQCMQLLIFHVMVLVRRTLESFDLCRLFVEKSGIDALLKLLLCPSITQSSEGMSIAFHSTTVFKCFTQHYSTLLAHTFCSSLKDHVKQALTAISGCSLLDTSINPDTNIFSSLSLVEFLLFLSVSKDNSLVTVLLTEFGNDNKNVLVDIGRIHREIMWQVALLEDTKVETEDNLSGSTYSTSRQTESSVYDNEDPRLNSFRQFLHPLLGTCSSFESQFFDRINLYRGLSLSFGLPQSQIVTSQDSSTSSDGDQSIAKKDDENKKSYHKAACDMVRSLSIRITHLFKELGKVMLLPSRRRDKTLNVSPASNSVAFTFASIVVDHMNFVGGSGFEASVSTKYRYFGKVAEFIDEILLETPDSCNPVILKCLYGQGVIDLVLTTFEATTQLPFAVNRSPASPLETEKASRNEIEGERLWIDGPLASYGKLMYHLATPSFILSPLTKHLITQPIVSGEIPFPRDAENFVKTLQSMVLKAVLPVWSHPRFPELSHEFVTTIVNIFRHVFSGVEVKNVSSNNAGRVAGPPPSGTTISRPKAEEALRQVGPEELQEDYELARALAMSLGNSGTDTKEDVAADASDSVEEEQVQVQVPPVDELLSACKKLLQTNDTLVFPVRDLLVMICSQNEGQERPKVLSFIIEQVTLCGNALDSGNQSMLSAFLHVLALILKEDVDAQKLALKSGLVKVASDLLSLWISGSHDQEASQVPKWVTLAFVAVDWLAQVDTSLNVDVVELLKNYQVSDQKSLVINEEKQKHLDLQERKRLIEIACGCLKKQLPSETTHAVLQLCFTLTRTNSVAVSFLDAGGLHLLLSLPASSLFDGFYKIAASIIRHILEDSHSLQQAMESQIKRTVATAASKQASGRLTARKFLSSLTSLVERDLVIFLQAAKVVCQVEMVVDRPYIVLVKDRDKDKSKEEDKAEKEKLDASSNNSKIHRKPPQSFINVIDLLLYSVISFVPPPPEDESTKKIGGSSETDMEIDASVIKGKGKAIATVSEDKEAARSHESSLSMAMVDLILKILTEILLMSGSSVNILVRKDASTCGIFHHVLYQFLPYSKTNKEKKFEVDCRNKLARRSNQFLVACCVRSTEARKRIFTIIGYIFNDFVDAPNGFRAPRVVQSHVDLLNDVLSARSPTGSCISVEASLTFIEAGLVQSLTRTLRVLDLNHVASPKVTKRILCVLGLVTEVHVQYFESNDGKIEHLVKPSDNSQPREDSEVNTTQAVDASIQVNENAMAADQVESFSTVRNYGGSDTRNLDNGMYPRSRIGESCRRGDFLDRIGGVLSRRSVGIKPVEAEGSPLIDTEGLKALIRLLRVGQPLYKNEHNKLLLNICAHAESRIDLLTIMMELLMLDKRKSSSDLNASEPPYRLYGCQSHVTYAHPQCVDGVSLVVSLRALETLNYLARNQPLVAKLLLEFRFPQSFLDQSSLTLLLSLLNQSLYLRSIAHLEQLLNLLDVVIDNVKKKSNSSDEPRSSASEQPADPPISTTDTEMNVVSAATSGEGDVSIGASSSDSEKDQNAFSEGDVTMVASSSGSDKDQNALNILNDIPKPELQLLCSLLAREGLSDNAYTLVAEVLRKLVAIVPIHCHLFISELADSVQSLTNPATEELHTFGGVEKSLSSSATHGAPVLRILQALISLVVSLGDKNKKPDIEKERTAAISLVRNINSSLEPLWQELSNCIAKIENYSDILPDPSPSVKPSGSVPPLPAGTRNLIPYIESFFLTCEKLHHYVGSAAVSDVDEASTSSNQQTASMPGVKVDNKFVQFSEKHRKLLNTFIRQNPGLLEKSFSLMLKLPHFIDFDNKWSHFRSKIKHQRDRRESSLRIFVRRGYILEDSYDQLRMRPAQDLKGKLVVHFRGEEGIDAGGLTREWYQVLSRVVFDKGTLLFTTVGNESTFQPNPNSVYQMEHLSYFKFVGRIVGKALFDEQLLDVHLTRSFYKHILGVNVTYHDIEAIDPDYFKNLKWLLENDISDILDLTFSIDADEEKLILYERTEVTDYELIPGGRFIRVTEENKHEYVDLVAEHRLTTAIRPQINAFMEGFNELISRDLISIFNDKELELLISGLPDIDLDDLRANTEYFGYSGGSSAIQWFWEVVQGFSKEDKALLLQFVTGTSKVPLEGFSALQGVSGSQKFQIHKAYGTVDHLPSAHTCFNQLDLPEYPSKQRLEERLLLAIHEANAGFGFC